MRSLLACLVGAAAFFGSHDVAASADYFKGKQLSLFVGYEPGGGYDVYARVVARHYGAQLPGQPPVVVKNMPGAGSLRATNYIYQVAAKDGTEVAAVGREIPTAALLDAANLRYKSSEFVWLGNLSSERSFCVSLQSGPVRTADDLFEKEFIVGGTTGGSATITYPAMMNALLGTKMKIISGYKGSSDLYLAMEKGEIDGRCNASISSLETARPKWLADKSVVFLVETSTSDTPLIPGIPMIKAFTQNTEALQAIDLLLAPDQWNRPYVAPPGISTELANSLKAGFVAMFKSSAFRDDMKRARLELDPMTGDEMANRILALEKIPDSVVQTAIAAIRPKPG